MKPLFTTLITSLFALSGKAYADLPTAVRPSSGGGQDGNWIELLKGYIVDGAMLVALVISVCGFFWLSWIALADVNKCRKGEKEWSELGLSTIGGAVIFLFVSYMLTQATTVLQ